MSCSGFELRRLSALEADAAREAADASARSQAAAVVVARLGGTLGDGVPDESATRDALLAEAVVLLETADVAAVEAQAAADRAREAEAALLERAPRRSNLDADLLGRLCEAVSGLGTGLYGPGSSRRVSRPPSVPASTPVRSDPPTSVRRCVDSGGRGRAASALRRDDRARHAGAGCSPA